MKKCALQTSYKVYNVLQALARNMCGSMENEKFMQFVCCANLCYGCETLRMITVEIKWKCGEFACYPVICEAFNGEMFYLQFLNCGFVIFD